MRTRGFRRRTNPWATMLFSVVSTTLPRRCWSSSSCFSASAFVGAAHRFSRIRSAPQGFGPQRFRGACSTDGEGDHLSRRIDALEKDLAVRNGGEPVNVHSPSQVSTAIFGSPGESTRKSILRRTAASQRASENQRAMAGLVIDIRHLHTLRAKKRKSGDESPAATPHEFQPNDENGVPAIAPLIENVSLSGFQGQHLQSQDEWVDAIFERKGTSQLDEFWREPLKDVSTSKAINLFPQLDPTLCPMAFDPDATPGLLQPEKPQTPTKRKVGGFLGFCREEKRKYPKHVLLVRMGDFYETFGTDAVMLVEHVGLNPMAGKAKAGCPKNQIQATLTALVEKGLTVAVYEEIGHTQGNQLKTRVLTQIVSPASPIYLYDNWLLSGEQEHACLDQLPASRPYVGILHTSSGYHAVEVSLEERSVVYSERLTPEAVACRVWAYPPADPLVYLPSPSGERPPSCLPFLTNTAGTSTSEGARFKTRRLDPGLVRRRPSGDQGSLSEADLHVGIVLDEVLQMVHRQKEAIAQGNTGDHEGKAVLTPADFIVNKCDGTANPLYQETAKQLGLLQDPAIPSLINSALDSAAPAATRSYLKRLLLVPPPVHVARALAEVIDALMDPSNPVVLPQLTVKSLGAMLSLIREKQAPAGVYGDLLHALEVLQFLLEQSPQQPGQLPVDALLAICEYDSGLPIDASLLLKGCHAATESIEAVVSESHHVRASGAQDAVTSFPFLPDEFFRRNEDHWRGRVRREVAADAYDRVDQTARELALAIAEDFGLRGEDGNLPSNSAGISHDINDNMLTLKKKTATQQASGTQYIFARDRRNMELKTRYTTERVQAALSEYVKACETARDSVASILSNLAKELVDDGHLPAIIQAVHLNHVLSLAYHHAVKATKQDWSLAELADTSEDGEASARLVRLSPYWMERNKRGNGGLPRKEVVENTFELDRMFLLTAPNMSGKSTLMRSTAAAILLTACGLCAPVGEGSRIPRFDTLFLRGASADVPTENKSAFGAEMEDMASLMRCCGPNSYVFVDEIGRGTSPKDGTRIGGAILEEMASNGMKGIFATHLHDILKLPLNAQERISNKQMTVAHNTEDSYEWTYRLSDGVCEDSLALVTAARFGLPQDILQRAEELKEHLPDTRESLMADSADLQPPSPSPASTISDNAIPIDETISIETTSKSANDAREAFQEAVLLAENLLGKSGTILGPGYLPPPTMADMACVYMKQLATDPFRYYVGQTVHVLDRMKAHRRKGPGWSSAWAAVFVVAGEDARFLEKKLIQELAQAGYAMESKTDGRTKRS